MYTYKAKILEVSDCDLKLEIDLGFGVSISERVFILGFKDIPCCLDYLIGETVFIKSFKRDRYFVEIIRDGASLNEELSSKYKPDL
jgi:hypothetical protein